MAKTYADLQKHVTDALSADVPSGLPGTDIEGEIVNEAGRYMFTHQWNFRLRPMTKLKVEKFSFTTTAAFKWTYSTLALAQTTTSTTTFANYYHSQGQTLTITAGTGATTGSYGIATRTATSQIVLETAFSTTDLTSTAALAGYSVLQSLALPADFGEINSLTMTGDTTRSITLTTLQEINMLRETNGGVAGNYACSIVYPGQQSATQTTPAPRLELYPEPSTTNADLARLTYYAAWTELSSSTAYPNIPIWAEMLLIQYIRALAKAYALDDMANSSDFLEAVDRSSMFRSTSRKDGLAQKFMGTLRNGAASRRRVFGGTSSILADPA